MLRLSTTIIIVIMLSGCGNDQDESLAKESNKLRRMAELVSADLLEIGFKVDVESLFVEVRDPYEMAHIFNQISDKSKKEVKDYVSFGPHVAEENRLDDLYFNDGSFRRLAFYDPNSKTIVFRKGASQIITKGYLAHELAHAYQDQKWGFENIWEKYQQTPNQEILNITQFIIEGHAELIRQAYEQRHTKSPYKISELRMGLGKLVENDCATCGINEPISNLPYILGLRFLAKLYKQGGWSLVEKIFLDMPKSTEQIIHPNKYQRDEPADLLLPVWKDDDLKPQLVLDGTLGEASLLSKLLSLKVPEKNALKSASGWDADRVQVYRLKNGEEALVWRIAFDRQLDAKQMESSVSLLSSPGEVFRIGQVVDWIISDSYEIRKHLRVFLSKNPYHSKTDFSDEKSTFEQEILIERDAKILHTNYFQPKFAIEPKL
jgi:hypothetical protein